MSFAAATTATGQQPEEVPLTDEELGWQSDTWNRNEQRLRVRFRDALGASDAEARIQRILREVPTMELPANFDVGTALEEERAEQFARAGPFARGSLLPVAAMRTAITRILNNLDSDRFRHLDIWQAVFERTGNPATFRVILEKERIEYETSATSPWGDEAATEEIKDQRREILQGRLRSLLLQGSNDQIEAVQQSEGFLLEDDTAGRGPFFVLMATFRTQYRLIQRRQQFADDVRQLGTAVIARRQGVNPEQTEAARRALLEQNRLALLATQAQAAAREAARIAREAREREEARVAEQARVAREALLEAARIEEENRVEAARVAEEARVEAARQAALDAASQTEAERLAAEAQLAEERIRLQPAPDARTTDGGRTRFQQLQARRAAERAVARAAERRQVAEPVEEVAVDGPVLEEQRTWESIFAPRRSTIIVSGFPAVGKTTFSDLQEQAQLVERFPGHVFHDLSVEPFALNILQNGPNRSWPANYVAAIEELKEEAKKDKSRNPQCHVIFISTPDDAIIQALNQASIYPDFLYPQPGLKLEYSDRFNTQIAAGDRRVESAGPIIANWLRFLTLYSENQPLASKKYVLQRGQYLGDVIDAILSRHLRNDQAEWQRSLRSCSFIGLSILSIVTVLVLLFVFFPSSGPILLPSSEL